MKRITTVFLACASAFLSVPAEAQVPSVTPEATLAQAKTLLRNLHPQTGDVAVPGTEATLRLGEAYYFLPAEEARKVLVDVWGNPPEAAIGVLGLIFPTGKTFLDDSWGAVVTVEASGYVSDEDAGSADYDALLTNMQSGESERNAERTGMGYPAQHLVGWAERPTYDAANHSMVWARNIRFVGQADNVLNYDVRLLGRRGVLSLNMVTSMSKLEETRTAARRLSRAATFDGGARYADYRPGTDSKADYGVAGLVAVGVGAAAAKKLGLLAIVLGIGKKFFFLILLALAGLGARVKSFFSRKKVGDEEFGYDASDDHRDSAPENPVEPVPPAALGSVSLSKEAGTA